MTIPKSEILIILPAYNESEVIEDVLCTVLNEEYRNICVVDDGSIDNTIEIANRYNVEILKHPINRGAGAAVQTGIIYARNNNFKYAVLMDSDGQHLASDINKLIDKMEESNSDIIIGNRFDLSENKIPLKRRLYNKIANIFTTIFCEKKYADTQSGFRLLNKKAIENLNLTSKGFGFCSEMIISAERLNLKIDQTPISVLYTEYSMNKGQNFMVGVKTARSILWQLIFK